MKRKVSKNYSLIFAFLFAMIIICFRATTASAANPGVVKLTPTNSWKTYTSYDVTGNGKKDSLSIRLRHSGSYDYLQCKINGTQVFSKSDYCGSSHFSRYAKLIIYTLDNGKPFLRFRMSSVAHPETYTIFDTIYQYKSGKLKTILNYRHKIFNTVVRVSESSVKKSGNKLICKFTWFGSTAGCIEFSYTYVYKNGTLKRTKVTTSNIVPITGQEKSLIARSQFAVYTDTSKTLKFYVPAGKRVTVTRIYFTAAKGLWYEVQYGTKKGWIPSTGKYRAIFTNAMERPA